MKSQTLGFNSISSNDWQREKEGMREIQKFEYLENRKKLLDEIKILFKIFLRAAIRW